MNAHDFKPRRATGLRALAASLAAVCLLSACAQIPTSGSVQPGLDEVSEPRSGYLLATGPTPGANRVEIVQGFLRAISAGPEDDFAVAREYLTDDARRTWSPAERTVVHPTSSSLEPILDDDDSVHLMTSITATLDREGRYSQAASGAEEEFTFTLVQDPEGEWRISQAPDATLMSAANFDFLYRATPIYFASQDRERLVPELRWFSERNQATAAAEAVLSGPAPWLKDAVFQAVPAGVRLSTEGVVIEDGVATVGLSDQILTASLEERGVLAAQMQQTLLRVPNVHAVALQSDSVPLVAEVPTIDREPIATGTLMALSMPPKAEDDEDEDVKDQGGADDDNDAEDDDEEGAEGGAEVEEESPVLLEFSDGIFTPLDDLELPSDPRDFAVSLGDPRVIAVSHPAGISRVREDRESVMLLEQKSVRSISWDRLDWLWISRSGTESQLVVINTNGEYQELSADWLVGREVTEARVARDGARVLIISRDSAGTSLDVAAVVRDDAGRPVALAEPLQLGASIKNPTTAVWVDSLLIATLAEGSSGSDSSPYLIEVGGRINSLPSVEEAKWLAAGKGERNLYLGASNGRIYVRDGQSWSPIAEDVSDPHFPG